MHLLARVESSGVDCSQVLFYFLYTAINWLTVALANIGKFGVSAAFAVIYVWSAELFPTMVRNSGMGSSSMMARVGGMVCPYIADLVSLPTFKVSSFTQV